MPSTTSSSVSNDFASSTVITPSLPTFFRITIGRDGADLGDLLVGGDILGVFLEVSHYGLDRKIDAALEVHRVHAGRHSLGTLPDDRVSEHGRRRRAVTGL